MRYDAENHTIETERLLLRPFKEDDADAVAHICNSEAVYRYTLALPHPYTPNDALKWIATHEANFQNGSAYEFAVTDKESGVLLGCVGLIRNAAQRHGELGYWFDERYWGNGYATEAARAVIDFAFTVDGLHRVFACHYAENTASGRVMQKCGMRFEGIRRGHLLKDGVYKDCVCYAILEGDEARA